MKVKEKIALVTVRYGQEIGGGAETLVKNYAENLLNKYDVDVITTKAIDHVTWRDSDLKNEILNGVNVKRFSVTQERNMDKKFFECLEALKVDINNIPLGEDFMLQQGPYSEDLLNYLTNNHTQYKYIIYSPYLYATTYFGAQITPKAKNILIPAAHNELFLYLGIMKKMFKRFAKLIFLTQEEKDLVNELFVYSAEEVIIGMEINVVKPLKTFLEKFRLTGKRYILYVGRIEPGKGILELIEFFQRYKNDTKFKNIKLVLVGKNIMTLPNDKDIIHLGYLSEDEKIAAMLHCEFLVLSSKFESFSIVTLEAMKVGKAVLVNGECSVLRGHATKANGGLWYRNYEEFRLASDYLLQNPKIASIMGRNGKVYVTKNYSSSTIQKKLFEVI